MKILQILLELHEENAAVRKNVYFVMQFRRCTVKAVLVLPVILL